jgi:UDP-2,3-diacylglucosamine pyrophosphatase LpxH
MELAWLVGNEAIAYDRGVWFVIGTQGAGKSSLLEHIGEHYLEGGNSVLDLYGSKDGESLAWLRSQYAQDKKVLLIHGDNVDVVSSWSSKSISKIIPDDFNDYDIVISANPLYSSYGDEMTQVNRIIDLLYNKRRDFTRLTYMVVREATNLFFSRIKVHQSQAAAKAEAIYLIREARHMGLAMGLDTLKFTSIDADIRVLSRYTLIKDPGDLILPRESWWIFKIIDPYKLNQLRPNEFFLKTNKKHLAFGTFPYHKWHKEERETASSLLNSLGIRIEVGEEIEYGRDYGAYRVVGDEEHARIVEMYLKGLSMARIGKDLNRGSSTVFGQIRSHNEGLDRVGFCARCKRVKSEASSHAAAKLVEAEVKDA